MNMLRQNFELDGKENRADVNVRERIKGLAGRVESTVRLRYLGIGFIWAWLYCSHETSALFSQRQGISINSDGSWLVSAVTVILAFFAGGLLLRRQNVKPLSPCLLRLRFRWARCCRLLAAWAMGWRFWRVVF